MEKEILDLIVQLATRQQEASPKEGWFLQIMAQVQRIEENKHIQSTAFDATAYAAAITKMRLDVGLSLREVGKEIGVSASSLSRLEAGNMPDLLTYVKVCRWLGEDLNQFFK